MDIGPWLFVLVGFSFPAFVFYSIFRACARIQRPINENPLYAVSAILLTASIIHILVLVVLIWISLPPITGAHLQFPKGLGFVRLLSAESLLKQFDVSISLSELSRSDSMQKLESMLCHFMAYTAFTAVFAMISAAISSRACIYGWWPFRQMFRGYYGGLYELYKGVYCHPVEASIMSKQMVADNKFIAYRGILDDVKLRNSGYIDHVYISAPQKLIVSYNEEINNIKGGASEFIDVDGTDQDDFMNNRLLIEGEDISNIFYKRLDDLVYESNVDFWIGEFLEFIFNPPQPWLRKDR